MFSLLLGGCQAALVSPYDAAIDKGIVEFYEPFVYFMRYVADNAGKPEGTYERTSIATTCSRPSSTC